MTKVLNLAMMTTPTVGTGAITLGAPVNSFLSFAQAGAHNGDDITYALEDGANREVGRGIYNAGMLTRNVLASTNANAPINLSGNATIASVAAAEDFAATPGGGIAPSDMVYGRMNGNWMPIVLDDSYQGDWGPSDYGLPGQFYFGDYGWTVVDSSNTAIWLGPFAHTSSDGLSAEIHARDQRPQATGADRIRIFEIGPASGNGQFSGALWSDTTTKTLKQWDGSAWQQVGGGGDFLPLSGATLTKPFVLSNIWADEPYEVFAVDDFKVTIDEQLIVKSYGISTNQINSVSGAAWAAIQINDSANGAVTIPNLQGYLPLSGGTLTGDLSIQGDLITRYLGVEGSMNVDGDFDARAINAQTYYAANISSPNEDWSIDLRPNIFEVRRFHDDHWSSAFSISVATGSISITNDLSVGGNVSFATIPTTDPAVAGRLWNDGGFLRVSAG